MFSFIRRRMMFVRPAPPYDAQVEYIEGTGTQYCDISVSVTSSGVLTIDGYISTANKELFHLYKSGTPSSNYQFNIESGATYYRFFTNSRINAGSGLVGNRHLWVCGNSLYKDGTLVGTTTPTATDTRTSIRLLWGTHGVTAGRIYAMKFDEGNTHIDCIPVRVGGDGYLYDRISGNLYGSAVSTPFNVGNDVN